MKIVGILTPHKVHSFLLICISREGWTHRTVSNSRASWNCVKNEEV